MKRASLDTLSSSERSERMGRVRHKDTKPELRVRKLAHALGYRYRLHAKELPGKPDLVFRPRRKAIFVHGCFWHRHSGCSRCRTPKSPERQAFWKKKFDQNVTRDRAARRALEEQGYAVLVIWECETESPEELTKLLRAFLG